MIHLVPPGDWEARLLAFREQRDLRFREDPDTPLRASDVEGFQGLDYFPPNPDLYFVGSILWYPRPEQLTMVTTSGKQRPCERVGWISFEQDGAEHRLQVFRLLDQGLPADAENFFLPFTDAGTGSQTYPAGRYLDLNGPPGGPYELDFNVAYNPSCAYGEPERFACPVTPASNRLALNIEAGERGYAREN